MDINTIGKLLPEFLHNFKGNNAKNLPDILNAVSSTGMLEGFIGKKYAKYLPLLPLLTKLNGDGFKTLLNDSETITSILPLLTQNDNSPDFLKKLDIASLAPLLPMITSTFKSNNNVSETNKQATEKSDDKNVTEPIYSANPLAVLAGIADKDILFMLNNYISSDI